MREVSADSVRLDFAVVGAGVAGLAAALSAPAHWRVGVFAKKPLGCAASGWAQGGIAAVVHGGDSFAAHQRDTEAAGAGLCNADAVRMVTERAPDAIGWLREMGVAFNLAWDGAPALTREGGHSHRRVLFIDDRSGQAVLAALIAQVRARANIAVFEDHVAVDLAVRDGRCRGFYALELRRGVVRAVTARAVLLATGGAGRVYLYSSTPADATGDGVGMAFRAGCRIANMEFVQFHPTCLYHSASPTLLISEAVRGEGGRLVNAAGESFTAEAPGGDLAPRDRVARAIDAEMKKSGADCVYLDCRARDEEFWRRRFPMIFAECAARGVRLSADKIPVVPAAHYCCGGVVTDLCGRTDLAGLLAAGEVACTGLHGANRLASNSLLECVVMGRAAGEAVAEAADLAGEAAEAVPAWDERRISPAREEVMVAHNWEELRRVMWDYVGIVRCDLRLQRARRRVGWIRDEIAEFYRRHRVSRDFLELRNLTQCAELIIEGALARRESRGLHYNLDCLAREARAVDTRLCREAFARRRRSLNALCPFSGRMVVAPGMMEYRGAMVGFCNAACRDAFAAAVANEFADAGEKMQAARRGFDELLGRGG